MLKRSGEIQEPWLTPVVVLHSPTPNLTTCLELRNFHNCIFGSDNMPFFLRMHSSFLRHTRLYADVKSRKTPYEVFFLTYFYSYRLDISFILAYSILMFFIKPNWLFFIFSWQYDCKSFFIKFSNILIQGLWTTIGLYSDIYPTSPLGVFLSGTKREIKDFCPIYEFQYYAFVRPFANYNFLLFLASLITFFYWLSLGFIYSIRNNSSVTPSKPKPLSILIYLIIRFNY